MYCEEQVQIIDTRVILSASDDHWHGLLLTGGPEVVEVGWSLNGICAVLPLPLVYRTWLRCPLAPSGSQ